MKTIKKQIIRNRDNFGRILTYSVVINEGTKDFPPVIIEVNTLKEANLLALTF